MTANSDEYQVPDVADKSRLFGLPGSMKLHFDIGDATDEAWDYADRDRPPSVVEEWTVRPPRWHLPTASLCAEWASECALDNELDEDGGDEFWSTRKDEEVVAAFEAALNLMASKVSYRMAHQRVALWHPPAEGEEEWRREAVDPNA